LNAIEFYDREGSTETRYFSGDMSKRRYHLKRFVACASIIQQYTTPGIIVMDLGAGEGMFTNWLSMKGFRVLGCDLSRSYLARVKTQTPDCDTILCSAEALPIRSKAIQLSLAIDVLEHVPRLRQAVNEVGRITSQSIVISMPVNSFYRRFAALLGIDLARYDDEVGHIHVLSPSTLTRLLVDLEREGLRQVRQVKIFSLVPTLAKIVPSRAIQKIIETTLLRAFGSSNHVIIVYQSAPALAATPYPTKLQR